jgi:two-component sensor histidine kinase
VVVDRIAKRHRSGLRYLRQLKQSWACLIRSRELLASELQHRVRNNLHLVIGMLNNYALSAFDDGSRQGSSSISRHVVTLTHIYESLLGIGLTSTT